MTQVRCIEPRKVKWRHANSKLREVLKRLIDSSSFGDMNLREREREIRAICLIFGGVGKRYFKRTIDTPGISIRLYIWRDWRKILEKERKDFGASNVCIGRNAFRRHKFGRN